MILLDGKTLSKKILENVRVQVEKLERKPHLVVILLGDDPASKIYVKNKQKAADAVGIKSTVIEWSFFNLSIRILLLNFSAYFM